MGVLRMQGCLKGGKVLLCISKVRGYAWKSRCAYETGEKDERLGEVQLGMDALVKTKQIRTY